MAFPIVMGIIFHIAFGDLGFDIGLIPVAVVVGGDLSPIAYAFYSALPSLGVVMDATVMEQTAATALLHAREISGVFVLGDGIELFTTGGGIAVSILETVANEFMAVSGAVGNIAAVNPGAIPAAIAAIESYTTSITPFSQIGANVLQNYFYVMLALGCFMGVHMGLSSAEQIQPDMSLVGTRVSVAAVPKLKLFFENLFAGVLMQFLMSIVTVAFYTFVLNVNFGPRLGLVLLACFVASAMSVALGMLIASIVKGKITIKRTLVMAFTNVFMIAAGMMSIAIRNTIRDFAPILDRINPVALISDTFVTLAIRENLELYIQNMIIMGVLVLVFAVISGVIMARRTYENI